MPSRVRNNDDKPGLAEASPHYLGHRERLRERFLDAGPDAVTEYELLELVLFRAIPRRDVKPLAKALIATFGSFGEVVSAPRQRLREIEGLGDAAIAEIKIVQAAANRLARGEVKKRTVLSSWSAVLDYCRTTMAFADKEQFRVLFLDKRNQIIADEVQQTGTVDHTPVYPREVIKRALELSATALILVHNHFSGKPTRMNVRFRGQSRKRLLAASVSDVIEKSAMSLACGLLEQAEHGLAGLRGKLQGGGGQLLAGLQREQVGAFLVRVGEGEGVGAALQRVHHGLGEVLADLHGRQLRTERLGLRTQRRQRGGQLGVCRGDVGSSGPVVGRVVDRKPGGGGVDGIDRDARGVSLVQLNGEVGAVRAVEQVDAVEARVARELVDLGFDGIELTGKAG